MQLLPVAIILRQIWQLSVRNTSVFSKGTFRVELGAFSFCIKCVSMGSSQRSVWSSLLAAEW